MCFACIKITSSNFSKFSFFSGFIHTFLHKKQARPLSIRERDINCQARLFMSGIVRRVSLSLFRVPRTQPLGQPGSKHPFREVSAEAGAMKIPQCDMNLSDQ
jgi:hypothetical protein